MKIFLIITFWGTVYVKTAYSFHIPHIFFDGISGTLPYKYFPLTEQDVHVSQKAATLSTFAGHFPYLNPLEIQLSDPYHFDFPRLFLSGELYFNSLVIKGLSDMTIEDIELRLQNRIRIDSRIKLPLTSIEAHFDMDCTLLKIPMFISGHLYTTIGETRMISAIGAHKEDEIYQLDSVHATVDMSDMKIKFIPRPTYTKARNLLETILNWPREAIYDAVAKISLKMANEELAKVPAMLFDEFLYTL